MALRVALRAARVVLALVARAVKVDPEAPAVQQVPAVLLVLLAAQATTASVSRGRAMGNPVTGQRAMASASRGLVTVSQATGQLVRHAMASASLGLVMESRAIAQRVMVSVNRGPVTESRAIAQHAMANASPGPVMESLGIVQRAQRVTASESPGLAMANQVTDHPGPEEIARSETPARRVRAATALSAITKPTR